jgi:hypothetical protein
VRQCPGIAAARSKVGAATRKRAAADACFKQQLRSVAFGVGSSGGRCRDVAGNRASDDRDPSRGAAQGN